MFKFRSQKGITLAELLTTVVIIGIVASMAVPRFQTAMDRMKFRTASRKVTSSLRLARSNAITGKVAYGIKVDGDKRTLTLFKDVLNPGAHSFEGGDSIIQVDTLPSEYSYVSTDVTGDIFFFEKNGSAYFVGQGNIITYASAEGAVSISQHNILASTGRVHSDIWTY